MFPKHTDKIFQLISEIPKDGGSRKDLGEEKQLRCHLKKNVGFNDVYGRLRWDNYSTTITGGCSKIALMIGNALPPKFSAIQAENIKRHLKQYLNKP
jgi:DNA (cytosine-5)-methyltransferase 1